MSNRDQVKKLIFENFPNGYESNPISGYCHYIIKNHEGGYRIEHLTSGMITGRQELAIPPKFYETPDEMFNDIKLYFNPKEL